MQDAGVPYWIVNMHRFNSTYDSTQHQDVQQLGPQMSSVPLQENHAVCCKPHTAVLSMETLNGPRDAMAAWGYKMLGLNDFFLQT